MRSPKPVALLCIALNLGSLLSPLLARADGPGGNPFTNVPGPVIPVHPAPAHPAPVPNHAVPHPGVPVRPTPLAPPHIDDPLVCVDPNAVPAQLTPFQQLVQDFISAYYADDPVRTHLLAQIAQQVFANPGSPDYIADLQYLDSQGPHAPEAMYDAGRALQNRWEAAYGMEISQRLAAGIDPGAAGNQTLGERRAQRVHIGENAGAMIGAFVALAALGIIALRNPTALPKYFAVYRAILPAVGFTGGYLAGHGTATALNASGFFERNIPLAPAHVMRLGVEKDDFTMNDETLVKTLVPLVLSIGAGEAAYVAIEGETIATSLLTAVRAFRAAGLAAAGAEVEFPPGLIATVVVTIIVDKLATAGINAWEYHSLKKDVLTARDIVNYGISADDNLTLYRGADTLVAKTLNLAAYINRPIIEANNTFVAGMAKAAHDHGEESPEFQAAMRGLTRELSSSVREALDDADQAGDADYEAYLALEAVENDEPGAMDHLPDLARDRADAYLDAFQTYRTGFEAYVASREEHLQANMSPEMRDAAYKDYFHRYVVGMRAAKDTQLAQAFRAGNLPRHAGHVLLQASALLRSSGREYVQGQADFLLAEVARNELLIRAAMTPTNANEGYGAPSWEGME